MEKYSENDSAYLFAYFTSCEEQLYYGVSLDGYHFYALNNGEPIYKPTIGNGGIRDPFIFLGEDGYAYILGTDMDTWCDQSTIVILKTSDYIHMQEAVIDFAKFEGFENITRAWAPQAIWCAERNAYMVYLAIWNPDEGLGTVMYRSFATDLMDQSTYTAPELLFDDTLNGVQVTDGAIDGDIIFDKIHNRYIMYYDGRYMATSDTVSGTWKKVTNEDGTLKMIPMPAVEGSNIWKIIGRDEWLIAADGTAFGAEPAYRVNRTTDFETYTDITGTGQYSFDFLPRHGYIVTISKHELNKLLETYGTPEKLQRFKPIPDRADPHISYYRSKYYFLATCDDGNQNLLCLREAERIEDLPDAKEYCKG